MNNSNTACDKNDYLVSHYTQCMFPNYLYIGKADQAKYALKYTKTWKIILDIIDRILKKKQILIIFDAKICDTTGN